MAINQSFLPIRPNQPFSEVPDDSRRIIYASLKSASDLDGGVETGGTSLTYNENGVSNGGDTVIRWTVGATDAAALSESCHIHFEVEQGFQAEITAAGQRLLTTDLGSQKFYLSTTEAGLFDQMDGVSANVGANLLLPSVGARDKTHINFDIYISGSTKRTYVDGLLAYETKTATAVMDTDEFTMFGNQAGTPGEVWGAGGGCTSRVRNFYVCTGAPILSKNFNVGNITQLGDSLFQQGNLSNFYPQQNGVTGSGDFGDYSCTARIIQSLARKGIDTSLTNLAVGGNTLADTQTIVNGIDQLANQVAVIYIGTNDARSGTLTAGWATALGTLITDVLALGVNHIFLGTLTSTAEDATEPDATSQPAVDEANLAIKALAASNADVTEVDLFTLFGGHNFKVDYYQANNLHWNYKGSSAAGELIGKAIANHYYLV